MEISPSFNFDDFSQFISTPNNYNYYPELQSLTSSLDSDTSSLDSDSPWEKRRKLVVDDNNNNNNTNNGDVNANASLKELLTSLLMADDDDEDKSQKPQLMNTTTTPNYQNTPLLQQQLQPPTTGNSKQRNNNNKRSRTLAGDSVIPPAPATHQRRLWVKDRSKDWWEKCNSPDYPPEEFKKAFRMSKETFEMICDELDPIITKKDTMLRAAIPVRQRVAVCIWRLATGEPLRLVSKRFGLGISTCHKLVLEVCAAIKTSLMPKFLQWPDETRLNRIKTGFESKTGIPNIGGSMYTTHIPIIAPKVNVGAYFNRRHTERNQKTSYSITLQGVVDESGVFTDVCIGWPGSMPDDQVLEKSALCHRANNGLLNNVWIVGSTSFPLLDWVLVPYTNPNLWTHHAFNEKIGEAQSVAKGAFSRLKGRWGCLQKRTEVKLQDLPVVLGACCTLHNICEIRKDFMDDELVSGFEFFDDEMVAENCVRSANAVQARDHIAHNLLHHQLPAGNSFL